MSRFIKPVSVLEPPERPLSHDSGDVHRFQNLQDRPQSFQDRPKSFPKLPKTAPGTFKSSPDVLKEISYPEILKSQGAGGRGASLQIRPLASANGPCRTSSSTRILSPENSHPEDSLLQKSGKYFRNHVEVIFHIEDACGESPAACLAMLSSVGHEEKLLGQYSNDVGQYRSKFSELDIR